METVFAGREPRRVLAYFEEVSKIPRASGSEEAIAAYLVRFAKQNGLEYFCDSYNNVLIRRAPVYPAEKTVLLQGHTDMVCVREPESRHDFSKDPLELFIDPEGLIGAVGTSLGADDGAAVAMMLAALEEPSDYGLECLFTASEEVGLIGAKRFDFSKIHSRTMINLDSEDEHEAIAGCAGGLRIHACRDIPSAAFSGEVLKIEISGLAGGHSGSDIHLGRVNAARLLSGLLLWLCEKYDCRLICFFGGEQDNAIPAFAEAEVQISARADSAIREWFGRRRRGFGEADGNAAISLARLPYDGQVFDMHTTKQIVRLISEVPNGVVSMDGALGIVKTSLNMGVVRIGDGQMRLEFSLRSSSETELDALAARLKEKLLSFGAVCREHDRYPAWAYTADSRLLQKYRCVYRSLYGAEPRVCAIHAGLECGVIRQAIPDMDMISLGPTMHQVHTVSERLDIASLERFWEMLRRLIHELE